MRELLYGLVKGFIKPVLVAGIDSAVTQIVKEIQETGKVSEEGMADVKSAVEGVANEAKAKLKLS